MNSNPEIYFAPHGCSVRVLGGNGNVLGVITWNAETQARFTPEEAVLRAAELNAAAGWSEPCVVNGVEIDVALWVPVGPEEGEPVSLFEAAGRPPGTVSRIHQYDAAACCRRFDELERQLAEVREQRDEVRNYLGATQRQLTNANAERDRLAEALHEVLEGRHGAFVRAKAALAAVEGGGK